MKQILCFGDSNTWGYDGESRERLPWGVRWTSLLQEKLNKEEYRVIEEGLCGRTTVFEDPLRDGRKGTALLPTLLETHAQADVITLMLETTVNHGKVFVSVKDHGSGIPKESLSRIWDRFYKIDASRGKDRKGTGLGLAIVKEIINAHKQNINVISTVGVGTEFIFTLEKAK